MCLGKSDKSLRPFDGQKQRIRCGDAAWKGDRHAGYHGTVLEEHLVEVTEEQVKRGSSFFYRGIHAGSADVFCIKSERKETVRSRKGRCDGGTSGKTGSALFH